MNVFRFATTLTIGAPTLIEALGRYCPIGWEKALDSCYKPVSASLPGLEAQAWCLDEGGFLAVPNSAEEDKVIWDLSRRAWPDIEPLNDLRVWIESVPF